MDGVPRLTNDPMTVAADRFLEGRRCVLFGAWTIDRPDDRWDAAVELAEWVKGVLAELGHGEAS